MRQLPILLYHWFRPAGSRSQSRSPQLEITPELFEKQMRYLAGRGYETVSLSQLFGEAADSPRPAKPLVITFDDGTLDFWEFAKPILEAQGFTATLFVVSGYVGEQSSWDLQLGEPPRSLMNWEQLREVSRAGFEIAAHSHSHRVFTELSTAEIKVELMRCREILREELGRTPEFFAYPRGSYCKEHTRLVAEAGFKGGCAVILSWRDLLRSERYALKRMAIKGSESTLGFRTRLALAGCVPFKG